jgi:glycosyltransferase involved in cell wall biosynthesis
MAPAEADVATVLYNPVLAFAHGAAPEIIEHGVNGFLCQDEHEMAELVEQAAGIEPMRCRKTAAERFAPDLVAGYEDVYRTTLARAADRRRTGAPAA